MSLSSHVITLVMCKQHSYPSAKFLSLQLLSVILSRTMLNLGMRMTVNE